MVEIGTYGIGVGAILATKLVLSLLPRRRPPRAEERTRRAVSVAAVVTVYNEAPETLYGCLASIHDSTRRPDVLTLVDDGSTDQRALQVADLWAPRFAAAGVDYKVIQHAGNWGKREALATGFDETPAIDIYVCIDSDTVIRPNAIERVVRYFDAPDIHCVAGVVLALNRDRNLLTRLIDMRYVNAFFYERAAYSTLGSVLCASGALAAYRGWVVRRHLDDLLAQRWLGRPAMSGDDRRLTYYCLVEGKAVLEPQAVAFTDVPERLGHFLRQQARWTRSFLRETLWAIGSMRPSRAYWWLSLIELIQWLAFTTALVVASGAAVLYGDHWLTLFLFYLFYALVASYARSLHYLRMTRDLDRALTFVAAPLYTALNITLLIPLRLWCLLTLRGGSWGTRRRVEVAEPSRVSVPAAPEFGTRDAYGRPLPNHL